MTTVPFKARHQTLVAYIIFTTASTRGNTAHKDDIMGASSVVSPRLPGSCKAHYLAPNTTMPVPLHGNQAVQRDHPATEKPGRSCDQGEEPPRLMSRSVKCSGVQDDIQRGVAGEALARCFSVLVRSENGTGPIR